jgi:hypothetical protein
MQIYGHFRACFCLHFIVILLSKLESIINTHLFLKNHSVYIHSISLIKLS